MKDQSKTPKWDSEVVIPDVEKKPCRHTFEFTGNAECKCKYCGMGLIGVLELKDGKPVI